MRGSRGLFARRRCIVPRVTSILIVLLLSALPAATDPNAPAPAAPGRPVSFRVFQNMDKPITSTDPGDVVREVFQNLEAFVQEGQGQMRDVADLSELQTKIDTFVWPSVAADGSSIWGSWSSR